jgi:PST family polysaccharide transporter
MTRFGVGYAAGDLVFQLHELVNPIVVGSALGPAAVGQVALATRLAQSLSFVKRATGRVAIVALAKVKSDRDRFRRVHAEGMALQLLGVGLPLAAFSLVVGWVVPRLFGEPWRSSVDLFPLIAFTTLVGTMFNLHSNALQVRLANGPVLVLRVAQVGITFAVAWWLVPQHGILGFGLAEVARLAAFLIVDRAVRRLYVPDYRPALPWLVAFVPPLATPWVGWPVASALLVPGLVILALPSIRTQLLAHLRALRARS